MHAYRISGLAVQSQMELPGAIEADASAGDADVYIRFGEAPKNLPAPLASGPTWELEGDRFLLSVPRLARMLVSSGREICVALAPGAAAHDAAAFVLGAAFGILLHQRGAMVLHGAAVARSGGAIAICGHSGAGKSTLAAGLCRDGCEFVADDICVVAAAANGRALVMPDGRRLKLWAQSIAALDLADATGAPVRDDFEKYFVAPAAGAARPPALAAIYVLRELRPPLRAGIERLALPDAVRTLDRQAYRPGVRWRIGRPPQLLAQAASLLAHTPVFVFTRPLGFGVFDRSVHTLREHWSGLE